MSLRAFMSILVTGLIVWSCGSGAVGSDAGSDALYDGTTEGDYAPDGGDGIEPAAPNVDRFYIGDSETPVSGDQFSYTPESGELNIDFGLVDAGTISRKYLFLRNDGTSDLILYNIEINAGSSADFMVACMRVGIFSDCPVTGGETLEVPSGSDLVFQVAYAPMDSGSDTGGLFMDLNVPNHKTIKVNLKGEGVTPEIQVCITECIGDQNGAACEAGAAVCNDAVVPDDLQISFGEVDTEVTLRRSVVITNQGQRPLQISGFYLSTGDFNQFRIDKNGNDLPGILPVGQQTEIFVIYNPGNAGTHSCVLEIDSNDIDEREIQVLLSGLARAPRLCPSPLFLDFGNVASGETSVKTLEVKNCGLLDLNLMNVAMNADSSSDFSLLNVPDLPITLTPDQTVDIEVQYAPLSQGTDHGGVDLFSNDPASNPANNLTGTVSLLGQSI